MKIGIIGSGRIGGTLAKLWAEKGYELMLSSKNIHSDRMRSLLERIGGNARSGSIEEVTNFADTILLAVPPSEVEGVLDRAGDLKNKVLINATNRSDGKSSQAEVVRVAKNARVIRAFNLLPAESLVRPEFHEANLSLFIAGDSSEARAIVGELGRSIGFDPVDVGGSETIPQLEAAFGILWKLLSPLYGRDFGFRLLRR